MINSMGTAPIMNYGFKTIPVHDEVGNVNGVHVVPSEQFAHNLDSVGECLCGPNVDYDTSGGVIVTRVVHFALDRGFYSHDPQDIWP